MDALRQQFRDTLQQEQEWIARLNEALLREQEVLSKREMDAIETVVAQKEEALGQLAKLAEQRLALLAKAGYGGEKVDFDAFIAADDSGQLADMWQQLKEGLQQCQQQNQQNGMLLESSRQQAQQMLSILLGQDGSRGELYDEHGSTHPSFGQNTSIKV
jgi:flagellar biosynthesis/type III secretory pathway chaperone